MKKILIVSPCTKRGNSIGLIGGLLNVLSRLDESKYDISLFDTNFLFEPHDPSKYPVDHYYDIQRKKSYNAIRRIPKFRAWFAKHVVLKTFNQILGDDKYELVIVHQVPFYAKDLVRIAHLRSTKIAFEPFGSDVLRVSGNTKGKIKQAFSEVDYVIGRKGSNVLIAAQTVYKVPETKIKEQREVLKGVMRLKDLQGKLSRKEMVDAIGIPYAEYNIVCGYSGRESHRHRKIIESLIQIKDVLPQGYQIVFPMTYGSVSSHDAIIEYASKLKLICDNAGLKTVFMTDFKTAEQIAYLHLITDLFIEIQPTDNGNAFIIEALFAKNQIVTGRWLNYKRFEQFGVPYYLIESPEELPKMLRDIFTKKVEKVTVPQKLIDFFDIPETYDSRDFWVNLFDSL